jgi:hypothetical protein
LADTSPTTSDERDELDLERIAVRQALEQTAAQVAGDTKERTDLETRPVETGLALEAQLSVPSPRQLQKRRAPNERIVTRYIWRCVGNILLSLDLSLAWTLMHPH